MSESKIPVADDLRETLRPIIVRAHLHDAEDTLDAVLAVVDPDGLRTEVERLRWAYDGASANGNEYRNERDAAAREAAALRAGMEALRRAIDDAGPVPAYHHRTMRCHRREWPRLWVEIDALLAGHSTPEVKP